MKIFRNILFIACFSIFSLPISARDICSTEDLMYLSWKADSVLVIPGQESMNYMLDLPQTRDLTVKVNGEVSSTTIDRIFEIWPSIRAEQANNVLTLVGKDKKRWSFRILGVERLEQKESGIRLNAVLLGNEKIPTGPIKDVEISSQSLPYITRVVDLLVYYTDSALDDAKAVLPADQVNDVVSSIQSRVALMNRALSNSRVPGRINLIDAKKLSYKESEHLNADKSTLDANAYLQNIIKGQTDFSSALSPSEVRIIKESRDELRADVVAIMSGLPLYDGQKKVCGIADKAFALFGYSCPDSLPTESNLAEQLGYLFGLQSDRASASDEADKSAANFAYVNVNSRFFTIMGTNKACYAVRSSCKPIEYFSSADSSLKYGGQAIGDSNSNAAQQLQKNFPVVADYFKTRR